MKKILALLLTVGMVLGAGGGNYVRFPLRDRRGMVQLHALRCVTLRGRLRDRGNTISSLRGYGRKKSTRPNLFGTDASIRVRCLAAWFYVFLWPVPPFSSSSRRSSG